MTPTEKLLSHLENILPRRDWKQQRDEITRMVQDVRNDGYLDGVYNEQHFKDAKPTEAKP